MIYQEAVKSLMDGKYVTRPCWESEGAYLVCLPGLKNFLRVSCLPQGGINGWGADVEASIAEDWLEIDPESVIKQEPKDEVNEIDPA